MSYSALKLTFEANIAHLQFNQAESYNRFTSEFWHEFPQALDAIDRSEETRVVVLSSTGKHFSAGMDLKLFEQPDPRLFSGEPGRRGEFIRRLVLELQGVFNRLESLRVPVLSAIQGGCIGGALDLVCACDCRYATKDAFFTVKETELGMVADLGTLQRLPRLIAPGMARELAYTGRHFSATEALDSGFVNAVYDHQDEMLTSVMSIAKDIAERSPLTVTGCKTVLNYSRDHSVEDGLQFNATWQAGMFQSADLLASMAGAARKQTPEYQPLLTTEPVLTNPTRK